MAKYNQLCSRCKQKYVPASWKDRYPVCYECHKKEMDVEIEDNKMKKLFDIPEEYYKKTPFLRKIKIDYLRYGNLTENQIKAFKDVVKKCEQESSSS